MAAAVDLDLLQRATCRTGSTTPSTPDDDPDDDGADSGSGSSPGDDAATGDADENPRAADSGTSSEAGTDDLPGTGAPDHGPWLSLGVLLCAIGATLVNTSRLRTRSIGHPTRGQLR